MRLHHQPRSRSTRVLWLLEELGVPFDLTVMAREVKQTPEYRALHPLGRSPVLEEDGGPVFESAALILHLADQNLDAGLIAPLGSHERALQYQWSFFAMTDIEGALVDIARQLWKDSGEPDTEVIERATARFVATAGVIENGAGGRRVPRGERVLGGRHRGRLGARLRPDGRADGASGRCRPVRRPVGVATGASARGRRHPVGGSGSAGRGQRPPAHAMHVRVFATGSKLTCVVRVRLHPHTEQTPGRASTITKGGCAPGAAGTFLVSARWLERWSRRTRDS